MVNYYINKEWILSARARRIYRIAAGLSLMFFILLVTLSSADRIPERLLPLLRLAMLTGLLGAALTFTAMEYFFFAFDESSAPKKIFWFFILGLPLLGPPLYCFIVYSKAPLVETVRTPSAAFGL